MRKYLFLILLYTPQITFANWAVEAIHMKNNRSYLDWRYTSSRYKKGMEIIGNSKNRCYLEVDGGDRVHEIWIYCRKRDGEDRDYTLNKIIRCERVDAVKKDNGRYEAVLKSIHSNAESDYTIFEPVCFWDK